MKFSTLKLILYWLISIIVFYFCWLLSYLLAVRYLLRQVSRFKYSKSPFFSQLGAADIFWTVVLVGGLTGVGYIFNLLLKKTPNDIIAAWIFLLLIIFSLCFLLIDQAKAFSGMQWVALILPGIALTIPFLNKLIRREA